MVEELERGATAAGHRGGGRLGQCPDMARRSYGSGSLVVRADANGAETWYGLGALAASAILPVWS
jgi:hypothetical protein